MKSCTLALLVAVSTGPRSLASMPVYAGLDGLLLARALQEALLLDLVTWTATSTVRITESGLAEIEREPTEWPAVWP